MTKSIKFKSSKSKKQRKREVLRTMSSSNLLLLFSFTKSMLTVMEEKSQKSTTKKKRTTVRTIKNSTHRKSSKHNFQTHSHEITDCPTKEQENDRKRAFIKRKNFPFNTKTWNDSLSDCPSTPLVAEDENYIDEDNTLNDSTREHQSEEKKVKEVSFIDNKTSHGKGLEVENPGLQLQDIENRYKLGKSSMYAWSSITDMDINTPNGDEYKWENAPSSKISIEDRISRRLREQRHSSVVAEQNTNKNNNSFVIKPQNRKDEATEEESEGGFPTYFSEGVDSESIATVTSSMSIPIPAFGENATIEMKKRKNVSVISEHGFLRLLSWCCLSLRSETDNRTWSCRDDYPGSCEGDYKEKDKKSR